MRPLCCPTSWDKAKRFLAICQSLLTNSVCNSYNLKLVFVNIRMLVRPFDYPDKTYFYFSNGMRSHCAPI